MIIIIIIIIIIIMTGDTNINSLFRREPKEK